MNATYIWPNTCLMPLRTDVLTPRGRLWMLIQAHGWKATIDDVAFDRKLAVIIKDFQREREVQYA